MPSSQQPPSEQRLSAAHTGTTSGTRERISAALQSGARPLPGSVADGIATLASRMASDDVLLQRIRGIVAAEGLAAPPTLRVRARPPPLALPMSPTTQQWDTTDRPLATAAAAPAPSGVVGEVQFRRESNDDQGDYDQLDDAVADAAVDELREIFRSGPFHCTNDAGPGAASTDTTPTSPPGPTTSAPPTAVRTSPRSPPEVRRFVEPRPPSPHDEDPLFTLASRVARSRSILHAEEEGDPDAPDDESTQRLGTAVASLWSAIVTTLFVPAADASTSSSNTSPQRHAPSNTASPEAKLPESRGHSRVPSMEGHSTPNPVVRPAVAAAVSQAVHLSRSGSALDVHEESPARNAPPVPPRTHTASQHGAADEGAQPVVSEHFLIAAALLVNSTLLWFAMARHHDAPSTAHTGDKHSIARVVTKVAGVLQSAFFNSSPQPSP